MSEKLSETQGVEMDEMIAPESTEQVCGLSFHSCPVEIMVQCTDGHLFCFECLKKQVEVIMAGDVTAHSYLPCMDTVGCKASIRLPEIRRALPNGLLERYEEHQAKAAIIEAGLENVVYCPFCNIACEVDKCVEIFDCPNPKCLKASCTECKKPSHVPLSCEEVDNKSETANRRKVEEAMTKSVVRECPTCKVEIVKKGGCNKVTCSVCGAKMCYICRLAISNDYDHFCVHRNTHKEPGKPCLICKKKCNLWGEEKEDIVALAAKEEALKDKEPNFRDQQIGPPFQKLIPVPFKQERGHYMANLGVQFLPERYNHELQQNPFFRGENQLANTAAIPWPPQFFRHDDQPGTYTHNDEDEDDGSELQLAEEEDEF